jgi:hypothetical protein
MFKVPGAERARDGRYLFHLPRVRTGLSLVPPCTHVYEREVGKTQ